MSDSISVCELQAHILLIDYDRFGKADIFKKWMLFSEESGELAKAIRVWLKLPTHDKTEMHNLEDEFGDVFYLLIMLANICEVDLLEALMNKIEKDKSKVYRVRSDGDKTD